MTHNKRWHLFLCFFIYLTPQHVCNVPFIFCYLNKTCTLFVYKIRTLLYTGVVGWLVSSAAKHDHNIIMQRVSFAFSVNLWVVNLRKHLNGCGVSWCMLNWGRPQHYKIFIHLFMFYQGVNKIICWWFVNRLFMKKTPSGCWLDGWIRGQPAHIRKDRFRSFPMTGFLTNELDRAAISYSVLDCASGHSFVLDAIYQLELIIVMFKWNTKCLIL